MSEVEHQADHARRAASNNSKDQGRGFVFYPVQALENDSASEGWRENGVVSVVKSVLPFQTILIRTLISIPS